MGATIRIGRDMLCLPYAGFFVLKQANIWCVYACRLCGLEKFVCNFFSNCKKKNLSLIQEKLGHGLYWCTKYLYPDMQFVTDARILSV